MAFSELKKFVSRWPRGLVVLAVLVFAVLLVLWLLGQIALSGQVTLVQIITALLVLAGLYWTSRRVVATEDNVRVAEEGHITDRFTKAIAHLGADKMAIRLGGIYALERIAKDSEKDHGPIMEILTAYVRENAPRQEEVIPPAAEKMPTDIQAILTVIGRRETTGKNRGNDRLDLISTQLVWADLRGANLGDANLGGARLDGADLFGATLIWANLDDANLGGAKLFEANLEAADLRGAKNLTAEQVLSTRNWCKAWLPKDLQYLFKDPPAWPVRLGSDNSVLCEPCALKSLEFFDTLHPPPKIPGNTPLQAGQLAARCL